MLATNPRLLVQYVLILPGTLLPCSEPPAKLASPKPSWRTFAGKYGTDRTRMQDPTLLVLFVQSCLDLTTYVGSLDLFLIFFEAEHWRIT
jgi:hypothetical protein